ncbi:MAG: hypothetical protein IT435_11495 [Phycisphaerales bacterium]|nr:hypothetical protein [Phycisphaerales bacterium]
MGTFHLEASSIVPRTLDETFRFFADEQLKGPYSLWRHRHTFEPDPAGSGVTLVRDHVEYAIPAWFLSPLVVRWLLKPDLDRIFTFRREALSRLLTAT